MQGCSKDRGIPMHSIFLTAPASAKTVKAIFMAELTHGQKSAAHLCDIQ